MKRQAIVAQGTVEGLGGKYHFHYPYYEGGVCRHCYDYQFPRAIQAGLVDSSVQGCLASG